MSYWGEEGVLRSLVASHPGLNLELETNEDAAQTPLDIAQGRGHKAYCAALQALMSSNSTASSGSSTISASAPAAASSSAVQVASSSMKVPVAAMGRLCNICYSDDHEADDVGVACDEDHFLCQECFTGYVQSESDTEGSPQSVVLNGGRVLCPQKKAAGCGSGAYANKLIAMVVSDELYERYLQARDFVVGKEAVAGALAKVKDSGAMSSVEQEQIRNLYKKANGKYSAYMCKKCKFGPIDHGWCMDLSAHHGENKGKGSSVNNSCPKCGWFANNVSQWPTWDGEFHEGGPAAAAAAASSSSSTVSSIRGMRLVFTGKLSRTRAQMTQLAVSAGATVTAEVSGATNVLVAGPGAGSKVYHAQAQGVEIWDEDEFTAALEAD